MNILLCIPTLNPGPYAQRLLAAIRSQTLTVTQILIVDSGSTDGTDAFWLDNGISPLRIAREQFDHGGTRQRCVELHPEADIVIFLTQDAVPADGDAFRSLVDSFADPAIGAAFGRQLPRPEAGPVERHARLFNYPERDAIRSAADIPQLGIKAAFFSNSFAAYRVRALRAVGGFPAKTILGEDTWVAAKLLLSGWKIAYSCQARAIHSHGLGLVEEARRYFDIGVFHAREHWLIDELGRPEGEGGRFIRSELRFLAKIAPFLIPSAFLRNVLKYLGYTLGKSENVLPVWLKRRLSLHKNFWNRESA